MKRSNRPSFSSPAVEALALAANDCMVADRVEILWILVASLVRHLNEEELGQLDRRARDHLVELFADPNAVYLDACGCLLLLADCIRSSVRPFFQEK